MTFRGDDQPHTFQVKGCAFIFHIKDIECVSVGGIVAKDHILKGNGHFVTADGRRSSDSTELATALTAVSTTLVGTPTTTKSTPQHLQDLI